jgi:hypothetical protein
VTDHETSVLSSRLHRLADDLAPPVDVVGQVREARARHRRQRRGRITLIAVATATAAVVVGTATAVDLLSANRAGEVAGPSVTPSTTTAPAPTTPATTSDPVAPSSDPVAPSTPEVADPGSDAAVLPAGWERRTFLGVSFAVPPGARMADYVMEEPPVESGERPTFIWNGFPIGEHGYAHVKVVVFPDNATWTDPEGYEPVTVSGAERAHVAIGTDVVADPANPADATAMTGMGLEILTADRRVHLDADFVAGPEGEQMMRDLIASLVVS